MTIMPIHHLRHQVCWQMYMKHTWRKEDPIWDVKIDRVEDYTVGSNKFWTRMLKRSWNSNRTIVISNLQRCSSWRCICYFCVCPCRPCGCLFKGWNTKEPKSDWGFQMPMVYTCARVKIKLLKVRNWDKSCPFVLRGSQWHWKKKSLHIEGSLQNASVTIICGFHFSGTCNFAHLAFAESLDDFIFISNVSAARV